MTEKHAHNAGPSDQEHDGHDDHDDHGHEHVVASEISHNEHDHTEGVHQHTHGALDPTLLSNERGISAIKISFVILAITALLQIGVAYISGSVALLADTIHNLGDAATAVPLWIAFTLARRPPTKRFTYGYGRVEDLAGVAVILVMLASAMLAGYESIHRLFNPQPIGYIGVVVLASLVGFAGNEIVALYRIRVGKEIGSAALIADGKHARVDGLTSLAVLIGAIGVALGFPLADPIVGLVITVLILQIIWESGASVFTRLLEGVDPDVVDEITSVVQKTDGVLEVSEVRVRWIGHWLHAEVNVAVAPELTVEDGHRIAVNVRHELLHDLKYLSDATIHVDPSTESGEDHHGVASHVHGELSEHSH
jgi:cation diffusion facilitator family transporter